MPGTRITVSLSEILEVTGQPLREIEIWSVLHQTTAFWKQNVCNGKAQVTDDSCFIVTPDSLCFCADGSVEVCAAAAHPYGDYLAPELYNCPNKSLETNEKGFVYSLGKTVIDAANFGSSSSQAGDIGADLEYVLCRMMDSNVASRLDCGQVLQTCNSFAERYQCKPQFSSYTRQFYNALMGSRSSSDEENPESSRHYETAAQKREIKAKRSRKKQRRAKERERSRSRSGSRQQRQEHLSLDDYDIDDENYDQTERRPPSYKHHMLKSSSMSSPGVSYHLSDITSLTTNQNYSSLPRQNRGAHSPAPGSFETGAFMGRTAYEKYLRVKERQRKLRVLRQELLGDEAQYPLLSVPEGVDYIGADARSIASLHGYSQGIYSPGLHMRYGSEMALRMRYDSDIESTGSSEVSHDRHSRSTYKSRDIQVPPLHHVPLTEKLKEAKAFIAQSNNPAKEYNGPEFIHKSSKPIVRVPVPLQGESLKNPSHARRVVIVLLTGQKLEAMVDPSTTGHQMFETIITHIELPEFFFFGLTYVIHDEHFFLEPDLKLHKIAPEGWKEGWKGGVPSVTLTLYLRVKFYPEDMAIVRHQITRHQLYLQLRHDLLEERLSCHQDKLLPLAGLALQSEYGNYDSESMGDNYFLPEHYFPGKLIQHLGSGRVKELVIEHHTKAALMSERQAQLEFIKGAMHLQEYGIHFYKLLKSKNATGSFLWLGIKLRCMFLAENHSSHRLLTQQYPWHAIQKVSFNKRRFSISIKPELGIGQPQKMNYYTNSFRKGSYLLQFLTAQHRFQLSMKARESQFENQGEKSDIISEAEENCPTLTDSDENSQMQQNMEREASGYREQTVPPQYRQPPPYTAPSVSMVDLREKYTIQPARAGSGDRRRAVSTGNILDEVKMENSQHAYVLGMSSVMPEEHRSVSEIVSESLANRFSALSPGQSGSCTFEVVLEKESGSGIGITIVGGDSDYGIFIKDVKPGGPADIEGTLRRGDKVLAINDTSLNKKDHSTAVNMIKHSPSSVKLLVSRVNLARTSNTNFDDDAELPHENFESDADDDCVHTHQYKYAHSGSHSSESALFVQNSEKSKNIPVVHASSYSSSPSVMHISTSSEQVQESAISPESVPKDYMAGTVMPLVQEAVVVKETSSRNHKQYDGTITSDDRETRQSDGQVYEVALEKKDGSFGLNIAGGVNTSVREGGIYVKSLLKGGAADLDRTMEIGDRILQIGDTRLDRCTHKQAVEVIRAAPSPCCFIMERPLTKAHTTKAWNNSPPMVAPQSPGSAASSLSDTSHRSPPDAIQSVSPGSTEAVTLPMNANHGEESPPRILSTSGDMTSEKADNKIQADSGHIYYPFVKKAIDDEMEGEENTYNVDLRKGNSGLGFSVYGGVDVDTNQPTQGIVRIKQVFPIGPAASSGKIQTDDVILEVNSKPVKGLTHAEIMSTLRGTTADVNLLMCRPDPEELSPRFKQSQQYLTTATEVLRKGLETSSQSETESEDEPILYRDTLPDSDTVLTPPSGFSSTEQLNDPCQSPFVAPPSSTPPPLPRSLPPVSPAFSIHSDSMLPNLKNQHIGRWGSFENLRQAVSPRSGYEGDMNSTFEITTDDDDDGGRLSRNDVDDNVPAYGDRLARLSRSESSGSLSDDSNSSTSSVVRSPLKVTAEIGDRDESSSQTTSISSDVTGVQSLQTNSLPHSESADQGHEDYSDEDLPFDLQEPPAPRGSPTDDRGYSASAFLTELGEGSYMSTMDKESDKDIHNEKETKVNKDSNASVLISQDAEDDRTNTWSKALNRNSESSDDRKNEENKVSKKNVVKDTSSQKVDQKFTTDPPDNKTSVEEICGNREDIDKERTLGKESCDPRNDNTIEAKNDESEEKDDHEEDSSESSNDSRECDTDDDSIPEMQEEELADTDDKTRLALQRSQGLEGSDTDTDLEYLRTQNRDGGTRDNYSEDLQEDQSVGDCVTNLEITKQPVTTDNLNDTVECDKEVRQVSEMTKDSISEKIDDTLIEVIGDTAGFNSTKELGEVSHDEEPWGEQDDDSAVRVTRGEDEAPIRTEDNLSEDDEQSGTEDSQSMSDVPGPQEVGSRLISIELKKSQKYGLGFSLVTAEKDNQTGVFVRSIAEDGAADRDGRLRVMDRLLQVNGESLVGLTHAKAIQMIRKSKHRVILTVSRLSSRQLEVMTPPIIMTDSDDDSCDVDESSTKDDYDTDDECPLNDFDQKLFRYNDETDEEEEDNNSVDSDEDDMKALVREAERLLNDSGNIEPNIESQAEGLNTSGKYEEVSVSEIDGKEDESGNVSDTWSLTDENEIDVYNQDRQSDLGVSNPRIQNSNMWASTNENLRASYENEKQTGFRKEIPCNQTFTIVPSQRRLDIEIPDTLTTEWIESLPLLVPSTDAQSTLLDLLSWLQVQVERDDPAEEYKELRNVKTTDDCTVAKQAENKARNRYRNILPYDMNRVELGRSEGYINASHILMNVGECEGHYIAAQGPMLETAEDFWQMTWEQNVSVIAMLTLDVENKKVKCHRYWPDFLETPIFVCSGTLRISLQSVEVLSDVDVRKVLLEDVINGEARIVYHVNFTSWPDHGIPPPVSVLQYIQLVHVFHSTGPILVHCSAGIGRTGAFITIDLALAQIETNGKCDIFEIVKELRKQRSGMIQTKDQYVLCYLTCMEALRSITTHPQ